MIEAPKEQLASTRQQIQPSQSTFCLPPVQKLTSSSTLKRWLRPEVYPLFAAVGVAVGICGMQLFRNISGNPEVRCEVRLTKEKRAAGVLDNFDEGEKYAEHSLRKFVRNKNPEPNINSFFADPK
uniref:NADH-ubiquinone reductase complex 1 MLRQ subunit n=1 Tax=Lactuca sativa TaxID=4236 RepID=A0A9R1VXU2_LACSA|nr:hypothetical protein LSAT_V11C400225930 [Lactuca sativa]